MKRQWLTLLGLGVAAVPLAGGAAAAAVARAPQPAAASQASAPAQAPAASEDAEYDALSAEFATARKAFDEAMREFKEKKTKRPEAVEPQFFPRFEALAKKGSLSANLWCASRLGRANLTNEQLKGRALGYSNAIVDALLKDEKREKPISLANFASGLLPNLVAQKFVTKEESQTLLERIAKEAKEDESKASASLALGLMPFASIEDEAERDTKSLEVYREIAKKYPQTEAGAEARGNVNRVENLSIGKVAPDFATTDVEGVGFKLSDYRGKVVVLDFWGFW
jgi:hypothetical protein